MSPLLVISSLWLAHAAPALGPQQRIDTPVVPSPAYGGQSYMGAVSNGDQIFVTWLDSRDPQASQLFGARVRHDGTTLDATGLPLGNGTEPRLAWDGTNNLMVMRDWADQYTPRFVARRISKTGQLLDTAPIVLTTRPRDLARAGVGAGGGQFLAAWVDNVDQSLMGPQVMAARIDAAGKLLDVQPIPVSARGRLDSSSDPAVSWNGSSFLVAWTQDGQIMSARISPAGALMGSALPVVPTKGAREAVIDFDGTNNLVAWTEAVGGQSNSAPIRGARVSPAGTVLDTGGLNLGPVDFTSQSQPQLVWTGQHHVLLWSEFSKTRTARVSKEGMLLDTMPTVLALEDGGGGYWSVLAGDGNGLLFVANRIVRANLVDVVGWRLGTDAKLADQQPVLISSGANGQTVPVLAWNGSSYLAVWADHRNREQMEIRGLMLDGTGRPRGASSFVLSTKNAVSAPHPAVATDGKDFLVAWEAGAYEPAPRIEAAVVRADGTVAKQGIFIPANNNMQTRPAIAWNGTHYMIAYRGDLGVNGPYYSHIFGVRVASDGTVVDSQQAKKLSASTTADMPALAAGPGGLLLAFETGGSSSTVLQRLSNEGVSQGDAFALHKFVAAQREPSVTSDGTEYFVTWSEARYDGTPSLDFDIYGTRVSASGEIRDPESIVIARARQAQMAPRVAVTGSGYVVTWRDGRRNPSNGIDLLDVYGARLSPTGVRLDPEDGVAIAATERYEDWPAVAAKGNGEALVVWQQYDDDSGVRSVRLVARTLSDLPIVLPDAGPPDAAPDAGPPDAGPPDTAPDVAIALPETGTEPRPEPPADAGVVAVDAGRDAGVDVLADAAAVPDTAVPVVAPADAAQAPDVAIAANVARHGCSCELGHRGAEMPAGAALVVLVVALRRRRRR